MTYSRSESIYEGVSKSLCTNAITFNGITGAYLGNIKEYALVGGGSPHGDVRDKKTIMGDPGAKAPGRKQL